MLAATDLLAKQLKQCGPRLRGGSQEGTRSWRQLSSLFRDPAMCRIQPGTVNISPAWYQQGHVVSVTLTIGSSCENDVAQGPSHALEHSASLKGTNRESALQWMSAIAETSAILSAILAVVHPPLYQAGRDTMLKLEKVPGLCEDVKAWGSPFNAVQIISNRETPPHRDNNSRKPWYDLLATIGSYRDLVFEMDGVGLHVHYPPGSVVALCGKVLRHSVGPCDGDRVCYAYFMRDAVHAAMGVVAPHWMDITYYD